MAHVLANDLRAAVLQAALEGKLTSRCKSDSDISESIHLIKCDIERKLKKKEIKKLPSYEQIAKDEWDRIPQGWRAVKLGQISYFISKGTTPRGGNVSYCEGGVGFLRAENIAGYDKLNLQNLKYISQETNDTFLQRSILKEHDILITIAGTLGRTGLVKKEDLPLNTNQAVSIVRTYPEYLDLRYIVMAINAPSIQKSFLDLTRTTAIPNLTLEIISNILIPLPPIEEQARIVAKVDEIMAKIDEYEKSEKKLEKLEKEFPEDMKASLLQAAMQGKLTEQHPEEEGYAIDLLNQIQEEKKHLVKEGKIKKQIKKQPKTKPIMEDEIPFDIPENWEWVRLCDLAKTNDTDSFSDGPFGSNLKREHQINKPEVRIIQLSNIGQNGWNDKNVKYTSFNHLKEISRCEVHPGDFVIAKMMPAGRTIIVPELGTQICLGSDAMKFVPSNKLNKKYLLIAMRSPVFLNQVYTGVHGITRVRTSLKKVKKYLVPLPPLSEQQRIVEKLDKLIPLCDELIGDK